MSNSDIQTGYQRENKNTGHKNIFHTKLNVMHITHASCCQLYISANTLTPNLYVYQQHFQFDRKYHGLLFLLHKPIYSRADIENHAFAY